MHPPSCWQGAGRGLAHHGLRMKRWIPPKMVSCSLAPWPLPHQPPWLSGEHPPLSTPLSLVQKLLEFERTTKFQLSPLTALQSLSPATSVCLFEKWESHSPVPCPPQHLTHQIEVRQKEWVHGVFNISRAIYLSEPSFHPLCSGVA